MLCVLCLVVAVAAIGIFLYLGRACSAQKCQKLSDAMDSYRRARTWDQKRVFFVFNVILLLKGGFWGFLTVFSVGVMHLVVAICGQNPWPYYFELWDRLVNLLADKPPSEQQAPAALQ